MEQQRSRKTRGHAAEEIVTARRYLEKKGSPLARVDGVVPGFDLHRRKFRRTVDLVTDRSTSVQPRRGRPPNPHIRRALVDAGLAAMHRCGANATGIRSAAQLARTLLAGWEGPLVSMRIAEKTSPADEFIDVLFVDLLQRRAG